jgi:GH15 family glucan-1,4-alpha-glucosidase
MSTPIRDYALISDCRSAALVSRDGSIDWLCWPRFDSGACFAALLGTAENGRWKIAPVDSVARVARRYRDGTMILETDFETAAGAASVVDFMPPGGNTSAVIRLVIGRRGRVDFFCELVARFDYGITVPWVSRLADGALSAIAGPNFLVLRTPVSLRGADWRTLGEFSVAAGETVPFVLAHGVAYRSPPEPIDAAAALAGTEAFWREWSGRCPSIGPWTEPVKRSLLVLKSLTYEPTGGMVAAVTTSLPEQIGGTRNWDYRYCWLRDASLTLLAFMKLGYYGEARDWRDWLMRSVAGSPEQMRIMYGIAGERNLPEWELPWLPGYENSRPVRVGNAAASQLQLDVYGELADAMFAAVTGGFPPAERQLALREVMLPHVERAWKEPDSGIWEVRGPLRHFTHSKVMAWVAFDRSARMFDMSGNVGAAAHWRGVADQVHDEVCTKGFDPELGSFVQSYGSKQLDASLLQLPLVGFLPPSDPRIRGTIAAIERRLRDESGLVRRYETASGVDGLPPGEGAFLACSFWLANNYVLQGRVAEARALFESLLDKQNDVGLLAEQYDPHTGRLLGNFPQAFSHVGLITTALYLARTEQAAQAAE